MNDTFASGFARRFGRLLFELLAWLPIWLLLTDGQSMGESAAWYAAAACCWIVGAVFARLRPPWRLLSVILATIALVAAAIAAGPREYLMIGIWLSVLAWRGRYPAVTASQYGLALGIAIVSAMITSTVDGDANYRAVSILMAIVWLVGALVALNRSSVHDAGLRSTIVTRGVLRDSRKYALLFIAAVLFLFGLTVGFGERLLKRPKISIDTSEMPEEAEPFEAPEQYGLPFEMQEASEPGLFWDILAWIVGVFTTLVFFWFIYWLWKDRTWSWRGLIDALRRLFLRDRQAEMLPYLEERRSLQKTKPLLPWSGLFNRPRKGPEWHKLNEAQKVRRLYTEAVTAAVAEGFTHEQHRTPAETLEALARWRTEQASAVAGRQAAFWGWFAGVRQSLLRLYERARYSPHEIRKQDIEQLIERHPERDKR